MSADATWRSLEAGSLPAHRRVDETHPCDFYLGLDGRGARELVLVASRPPSRSAQAFKAFESVATVREDGRYSLTTKLKRPELGALFGRLCDDLIESARNRDPEDVMAFVQERLGRWEILFARDADGLMDEMELRGFIAELLFLRDYVLPVLGPIASVYAWRGPLGNDHDFEFARVAVEVKSVNESRVVTISSPEQLDDGPKALRMSVFQLERSVSDVAPAFSATELVKGVRSALHDEADAAAQLEDKLSMAGFSDHQTYSTRYYTVSGVSHFRVSDGFPRIRQEDLSPGIENVRYSVDLRQCAKYLLATLDLAHDA